MMIMDEDEMMAEMVGIILGDGGIYILETKERKFTNWESR